MNLPLIVSLACTALFFLVVALFLLMHDVLRYHMLLRDRVDNLSGKSKGDVNTSLFKDLKQFDADMSKTRMHWRTQVDTMLRQANMPMSLRHFVFVSLGSGIIFSGLSLIGVKHFWAAPIGMIIGALAPIGYVQLRCALRMHRLVQQLPETFDVFSRVVRSGQTTTTAFQIVGDEFEAPIAEEFRRCYEEQNLGMPRDTALRNLASRTGVMEMRIFVVALLLQSRSGGNLVEILGNLSSLVRSRVKLQMKVRALTGDGRMQATVLIVLPFVAFAGLRILSPNYISCLLEHPMLLGVAVLAQAVGALWIRQIIKNVK